MKRTDGEEVKERREEDREVEDRDEDDSDRGCYHQLGKPNNNNNISNNKPKNDTNRQLVPHPPHFWNVATPLMITLGSTASK